MSVCLIDTTILCNVIPVPGRDQQYRAVDDQMAAHVKGGTTMVLPLASIIETGNHIARCRDGAARREAAEEFVRVVTDAVLGRTPFPPTPFYEPGTLLDWLAGFPDPATRGIGFADHLIIEEFERQCALHPHRHVFIWSLDRHLSGYDRPV